MELFAPLYFETEKFSHLAEWLQKQEDISLLFVLVDENTHQHCLPLLLNQVEPMQRVEILEIPSGEENKSLEIAAQLWASLTELKADRHSLIINLGGGVISDMGGFVASCYKRGIRFINVPTTLLAQVDAAHGGKTGIDFEGFKNQIGTFAAAEATFVYPGFMSSLPYREFISGFAECVKHALIYDTDLWQALLINGVPDPDFAEHFIEPSVEIKKKIVLEDPTEKGLRKILNFGHTVGHALESLSITNDKEPLLHGEAIAMGMIAEMYMATHLCNLSQVHLHIASKFISEVFPLRTVDEKQFHTVLQLMQQDKKNWGSEILCSLISEPGQCLFDVPVSELIVFESLEYLNQTVKRLELGKQGTLFRSNETDLKATIELTGSKSESNRALIIKSLCEPPFELNNLSEAEDTVTLEKILKQPSTIANVGPAGTAMRFLAARFCLSPGEHILTGSDRMKERPIGILVDGLRSLGAEIDYIEKEGFPPLKIKGGKIKGGSISIDGSVSSQFISALCMIGPVLELGLELEFVGEIASRPYLDMTLTMMEGFGVKHSWNGNKLSITPQAYVPAPFVVEPDWSAASYWYAAVALSSSAVIQLPNLRKTSLQGDAVVSKVFKKFGVKTTFSKTGIELRKMENFSLPADIKIDCETCPDLAQTFATTIAGLGISGKLTGLKSLRIKETDRIKALITELAKFGITATEQDNFVLEIKAGTIKQPTEHLVTYQDHRMAMAFAPLLLLVDEIVFDEPEVVGKSYPDFWHHLRQAKVIQ